MAFKTRLASILIVLALLAAVEWSIFAPAEIRTYLGILSTEIGLSGYGLYIWQMYPADKEIAAKPDPLTWVLFGCLTATGALVQWYQGAGLAGSVCLAASAIACFIIFAWSGNKFGWNWKKRNAKFAIGAGGLFLASVITGGQPEFAITAALLATGSDFVSYGPSVLKALEKPWEDSATNYLFNSTKCIPALFALSARSISTETYLYMLLAVNALFAVFLFSLRHIEKEYPIISARLKLIPTAGFAVIFAK